MSFSFWGQWDSPSINFDFRPAGYLVLFLYLIFLTWLLYQERRALVKLTLTRTLVWLVCIFLSLLLSNVFVFQLAPARAHIAPATGWHSLALLAGLPIVLAGAVGIFPAALVGLAGGLVQSLWLSHQPFNAFEMAIWGAVTAYLVRQDYRGHLPRLLRLPLVASPVAALVVWATYWLSCVSSTSGDLLSSVLRCWTPLGSSLPLTWVGGVMAGLIVQVLFLALPSLVPTTQGVRTPPYARSLKAQVLFAFVPTIIVIILILFYAVNATAINVATEQSIAQATRDSNNASERIPSMLQTGQALLSQFAADEVFWSQPAQVRQARLQQHIRAMTFFKKLILLDKSLQPLNIYPPIQGSEPILEKTEESLARRVTDSSAFQMSPVHRMSDGSFVISFLSPVVQPPNQIVGVLMGRADIEQTTMIRDMLTSLQGTMGAGKGFVVDERQIIILDPAAPQMLTAWAPNPRPDKVLRNQGREFAYVETAASGARQLVYYAQVKGTPWKTVIIIPYEAILALAVSISTPFTVILLLVGLAVGTLIPLLSVRLTRPIEALSNAAAHIAEGQLDAPVTVSGASEVGRLGSAFETMRVSLQKRLKELALLLTISRAVSANLNLERSLEPILAGAMQATSSICARIILVSPQGSPERELSARRSGQVSWKKVPNLSGPLLRLAQNRRAIKVRDTSIYPAAFSEGTATALGFPLLIKDRLVGALVVEYESRDDLPTSEIEFLSTLAGQAAVAIESARLFEAVESERQRLAAILTSTSDAIIVTDSHNAVLLVNPAAQQTFGLSLPEAGGQPITALSVEPDLVDLLTRSSDDTVPRTSEITLADKRTLYASASPIMNDNGQVMGRVVVMRDITHLKEIDALKSEFVATVSHDLRSPLTSMMGYTTLMFGAGSLTDRQQEFIEKIRQGIAQMTELIDNLLDIGKIEAGIGVNMMPCQLERIIQEVAINQKSRALEKQLSLTLDFPTPLPPVTVDATLIREALDNLIDNAIKYTPAGFIRICAQQKNNEIIMSVQDSGLGVPAADQPRVFEKFYRAKTRDTINITGTGLGLAIVKSVAELHKGRVWLESKPNQGSTFFLALPVQSTPQ